MFNKEKSMIFSNISNGFALSRSGATNFLRCEKFWSYDGELISKEETNSKPFLCGAYTIHELLNIKSLNDFERGVYSDFSFDVIYLNDGGQRRGAKRVLALEAIGR